MRLIDGRAIAAAIAAEVTEAAARTHPTLAVVVPTDDEATAWYVRSIERAAAKVGVACRVDRPDDLIGHLDALSADPDVDAVICQTPLPAGLSPAEVGASTRRPETPSTTTT